MNRALLPLLPHNISALAGQFAGDTRLAGRRFLLSLLFLMALVVGPSHSLRAQEPSESHRIYLPQIQQDAGSSPSTEAHGEWPGGRHYTVRRGDTLLSVALEMGVDLHDMGCLITPAFTWDQPLVIGDTLTVPDTPFACHQVEVGDTVASIAARYDVSPDVIWNEGWNGLIGEPVPGHYLRVPLAPGPDPAAGILITRQLARESVDSAPAGPQSQITDPPPPVPHDWPYGSGEFAWPAYGWITQGYRAGHSAIDLAAPLGTPVTAADRGVVIRAGWSTVGYGQFVVIDHNIDYITLYAHLSELYVEEGDVVAKGQLIGRVGSTGNSTGPHLHFEIRDFGQRVDPLTLLPR